jgi:hypothetical protein
MAYKKYIQRNGKLYGPYIYQSKRVDGKVVSEYYGSEGIKKDEEVKKIPRVGNRNYKRILFIFIGVIVLAFLVYLLAFSNSKNNKLTGGVVLGLDTSYESGKPLSGVLKFSLKEGELLPGSSKIVFENSGNIYEFPLSDVITEVPADGNYYIDGKNITGSGPGYGVEGEETVYPDVQFVLQVYNEGSGGTTPTENASENVTPSEVNTQENVTGESTPAEATTETTSVSTTETTPESTQAPATGESSSTSPITGGVVKSSGGFFNSLFGLTGNVVSMELEKEVDGVVSNDKPFVYDLQDGETAEVQLKSVKVNGEEVGDNVVSLKVENNKATVTTDYSKTEKGYGNEFTGEKEKTISLDLSRLNLSLEQGDLNVKLVYGNEEILQLTTPLKEGEKTSGEVANVVKENVSNNETPVEIPTQVNQSNETVIAENQTVEEIVNTSMWDMGDFLTPQDKNILADNFGNISLNSVKSELFNGRLIRGYEFGGYTVEYSYDASLNKDILNVQMEKDRIKFLKDIADSILKENNETSPQALEGYNQTYIP